MIAFLFYTGGQHSKQKRVPHGARFIRTIPSSKLGAEWCEWNWQDVWYD